MGGLKDFVINKGDVSDNARSIGEDGEFISVTEMSIDIDLGRRQLVKALARRPFYKD